MDHLLALSGLSRASFLAKRKYKKLKDLRSESFEIEKDKTISEKIRQHKLDAVAVKQKAHVDEFNKAWNKFDD